MTAAWLSDPMPTWYPLPAEPGVSLVSACKLEICVLAGHGGRSPLIARDIRVGSRVMRAGTQGLQQTASPQRDHAGGARVPAA